jgi:uncharacterized membrane protein YhaH (DUF805 family)
VKWYLLALKKYATFDGRSSRTAFWSFCLFNFLFLIGLTVLDAATGVPVFSTPYWLLTLVPSLAVGSRRLHDVGMSGWFQLIAIIPFGIIFLIVVWCRRSKEAPNDWGASAAGVQPA